MEIEVLGSISFDFRVLIMFCSMLSKRVSKLSYFSFSSSTCRAVVTDTSHDCCVWLIIVGSAMTEDSFEYIEICSSEFVRISRSVFKEKKMGPFSHEKQKKNLSVILTSFFFFSLISSMFLRFAFVMRWFWTNGVFKNRFKNFAARIIKCKQHRTLLFMDWVRATGFLMLNARSLFSANRWA